MSVICTCTMYSRSFTLIVRLVLSQKNLAGTWRRDASPSPVAGLYDKGGHPGILECEARLGCGQVLSFTPTHNREKNRSSKQTSKISMFWISKLPCSMTNMRVWTPSFITVPFRWSTIVAITLFQRHVESAWMLTCWDSSSNIFHIAIQFCFSGMGRWYTTVSCHDILIKYRLHQKLSKFCLSHI